MSQNPLNINTLGLLGGVVGIATIGLLSPQSEAIGRVATVDVPADFAAERPDQGSASRPVSSEFDRPDELSLGRDANSAFDRELEGSLNRPNQAKSQRIRTARNARPRSSSTGKRT